MVEDARKRASGLHILVAHDKIYRDEETLKLAKGANVELAVPPAISEAVVMLEKLLETLMDTIDKYEKTVLLEFLVKNLSNISEHIRQHGEFPAWFLTRESSLGLFPQIESIDAIEVVSIHSATRGVLPEGSNEGRAKVSFVAKTRFRVSVREWISPPQPAYKLGKRAGTDLLQFFLSGSPTQQTVSKTTDINIPVEGSVLLKRIKDDNSLLHDNYSDLEIDNLIVR